MRRLRLDAFKHRFKKDCDCVLSNFRVVVIL